MIIPPAAITRFLAAAASKEKEVLDLAPEVGVGLSHVASLIGKNAHRVLWPHILRWAQGRFGARALH
jgi:polyhydroxyalkanoate synthase subunit PhaC